MIGLGSGINSIEEFNRRAAIALNGAQMFFESRAIRDRIETIVADIRRGHAIARHDQDELFSFIYQNRRRITDKLVVDYASERAKGY